MTELDFRKETNSQSVLQGCSFLNKKICVILTAYNDESSISYAVQEFLSQKNVVEVIVVDNNSVDYTSYLAEDSGAIVAKEQKQGYGFACICGLKNALHVVDADVIVLAEGDMTFRGRDIWKLLPFTDDADFVVGSRCHMAMIDSDCQMDWFYLWGNLFIAKILQFRFLNSKFLGRARFTDVGCTLRAIRRESLLEIIDDLKVGGHTFSPHMIKVALEHGLKVIEVPVTLRKRVGKSKGAGGNKALGFKVGLKMIRDIMFH